MKRKSVSIFVAVAALVVSVLPATVSGQSTTGSTTQSSNNSNSLRISPVRTDIAMDPGTTKELTVYAQNLGLQPVQARAVVSDFDASTDETGKPNVLLNTSEYAKSHSLKRLSSIQPELVTLTPNTRIPVKLTITVPQNQKAGGYYGAVRFVPASNLSTGEDTGVAIATNVGSLVLLRVNGDLEEKLTLESFDIRQNDKPGTFFNSPDNIKARVRLNNVGNIQTQPYGKVRVFDHKGKVVEEHEINNTQPRGNVLPDSIRRFEIDFKKLKSFGKYTVEANLGYGSGGELLTTKSSFWVVPVSYMIGGVIGLLFLVGIIFLVVKVITLSRRGRRGNTPRRY